MLKASIVINTFNRRPFLERTLESLTYLRYESFEVVCVDGPSVDGTAELLEAWRGKIKIAHCPEANLSRSRNIGIQHSAGDIICFIDDDAVPEPTWLSAILAEYENPCIAAVGGYIRDHTGIAYQAKHIVCDRFADSVMYDPDVHSQRSDFYHTAITGTNCSFRRDILVNIGGFDEVYAYFLDETDVLIRLHDAGYGISCIENAEIHHKYAPSSMRNEQKIAKTLYYPVRSKVYYAYRHALILHGLKQTASRIDSYLSYVRASQILHRDRNNMSADHCRSLLEDIDRGRKDGLELAFHAGAPFVKEASYFTRPPEFLPFHVTRCTEHRLKICFISCDYLPRPNGGIGVWVGTLARRLAEFGNEVSVITRTEEEASIDFEDNVWVHRIKQQHFPQRPYAAPENLPQIVYDWSASAYAELLQVALMRGVDVVSAPIWDVEGIVAHCSENIPVVLSLHTSYGLALPSKPLWHEMPGYMAGHVQPILETEKLLFDKAPLIIANSQAIVSDLEACYGSSLGTSRLALVPHGLRDKYVKEPNLFTTGTKKALTVLFVGRFEERKGIDVLLAVIPAVVQRYLNVRFVLAGDNSISDFWGNFLKQYKNEDWFARVQAPGFVSREQLTDMYKKCDIFVAPSRYESFGLIYLEAMMWGKPCIGTNVGGIPEVVRNGVNGTIVAPGFVDALQKALFTLIEQEDLRESMGNNAREIFLNEYTDSRMAEKVEYFLKAFLKENY